MNKFSIVLLSIFALGGNFLVLPLLGVPLHAASSNSTLTEEEKQRATDEEAQKKENADDIKDDLENLQKRLNQATQKKQSIERSLNSVTTNLSATINAIKSTKAALRDATDTIQRKELEVELLEENIVLKKEMLTALMQEMYFNSDKPLATVMLGEEDFSSALDEATYVSELGEKVQTLLADVKELQDQTQTEREKLEIAKKDNEKLLAEKSRQQQGLIDDQSEIQDDLKDQEATIAEIEKKMSKLKNELSGLLGKNISTNDVMEAATIASKATGVRRAFILGELTQESGLGRFTGGCYYKNTRVKPADKAAFKTIMDELGYDVNKKKISCSPGFGYGGAMGIAQFMPTTWIGYKSKISSYTGHKPPDPWSVIDGVMGMAIKLANAGATSKSGEINASKVYYCGSSRSPYWNTKCNDYARSVQWLAKGYEK